MKEKPTLYFAAALFSGRESSFNLAMTRSLECRGYKVLLPQRDGFLMVSLMDALKSTGCSEPYSAARAIIYTMDIGKFERDSNVVLANLDEPIDEGVVVEQCYARMMGKPVIGYRTDIRSPFGERGELFNGMHCFPGFNCDSFISCSMQNRTIGEQNEAKERLATAISGEIERYNPFDIGTDLSAGPVRQICELADTLFERVGDIHSNKGLRTIAKRYAKHRGKIRKIFPRAMTA